MKKTKNNCLRCIHHFDISYNDKCFGCRGKKNFQEFKLAEEDKLEKVLAIVDKYGRWERVMHGGKYYSYKVISKKSWDKMVQELSEKSLLLDNIRVLVNSCSPVGIESDGSTSTTNYIVKDEFLKKLSQI